MKKPSISKESIIIVVVLTLIAMISGLILGLANKFTAVDEAEALKGRVEKFYTASAITETLDITGYKNMPGTEILSAFVAGDGTYIIQSKSEKAYSGGGLILLVAVKDGIIIKIDGSGNSETPGLGSKALTQSFFEEGYIGLAADSFSVETSIEGANVEPYEPFGISWTLQKEFKTGNGNGDDIAAVTGATKTSNGVRNAVAAAAVFYNAKESVA